MRTRIFKGINVVDLCDHGGSANSHIQIRILYIMKFTALSVLAIVFNRIFN